MSRLVQKFAARFNHTLGGLKCKTVSWELPIDGAKRKSILKNYQHTQYPHFSVTPKTGDSIQQVFLFYCVQYMVYSRKCTPQNSYWWN